MSSLPRHVRWSLSSIIPTGQEHRKPPAVLLHVPEQFANPALHSSISGMKWRLNIAVDYNRNFISVSTFLAPNNTALKIDWFIRCIARSTTKVILERSTNNQIMIIMIMDGNHMTKNSMNRKLKSHANVRCSHHMLFCISRGLGEISMKTENLRSQVNVQLDVHIECCCIFQDWEK